MNTQLQSRKKATATPLSSFISVPSGLIQRKCACGGTPGVDGECAECRAKRLSMQRSATHHAVPLKVSPLVYDVLRSPGQPLDTETRAFIEPRFGHDFSKVRVHTDANAADSARSVNARAYTLGKDVVFGARQYAPETKEGRQLLAHELTHVVQQRGESTSTVLRQPLRLSEPSDSSEQVADSVADRVLKGQATESIAPVPSQMMLFRKVLTKDANFTDPNDCWHKTPPGTIYEPPNPGFIVAIFKAKLETPEKCNGAIKTNVTVTTEGASARPGRDPGGATRGFFDNIRFGVSDGKDTGGLREPTKRTEAAVEFEQNQSLVACRANKDTFIYIKLDYSAEANPYYKGIFTFAEVKFSPRISPDRGGKVRDGSTDPTIRVEICDGLKPSGATKSPPEPGEVPTPRSTPTKSKKE